jgi:GNAT superfamily N-acetyltransferase
MDNIELIELQITLEYNLDERCLLVPFPGSTEQAMYIVYRDGWGCTPFFNHQLPTDFRARLLALGSEQAFAQPALVCHTLKEYAPCQVGGVFVSGYFTHRPSPQVFPDVTLYKDSFVIMKGGKPACWALSVRQNERCAEVYVETLPEFRRRGYGRQVVAAWANQIVSEGRTAFYSYKAENIASAGLAASLGVVKFADVVGFE